MISNRLIVIIKRHTRIQIQGVLHCFFFFNYFPLCLFYTKIVFFLFSCAIATECNNKCIYKIILAKIVSDNFETLVKKHNYKRQVSCLVAKITCIQELTVLTNGYYIYKNGKANIYQQLKDWVK